MNRIKKYLAGVMILLLILPLCVGCGVQQKQVQTAQKKLSVVVTIFPAYDWVMQIFGDQKDKADVTLLLDGGVDLHSYQPTAQDIVKIADCDVFVTVGGESDAWVEDALSEAANKNMTVINMMEALGRRIRDEETVEGMFEKKRLREAEEETESDEHVWLSIKNAAVLCEALEGALSKADPDHGALYKKNVDEYIEKLEALDREYKTALNDAPQKTLLFADRFPFRYLVDDYGLNYYAAFAGCSAESEADFETIIFLANKVDTLHLHTVLTLEDSDGRMARTIVASTKNKNSQILTMNAMQSTTTADAVEGATYIGIMQKNLKVLKEATK